MYAFITYSNMNSKLLKFLRHQIVLCNKNKYVIKRFVNNGRSLSSIKTDSQNIETTEDESSHKISVSYVPKEILQKVQYNSILSQRAHLSWSQRKRLEAQEKRTRIQDGNNDAPLSLQYVYTGSLVSEAAERPIVYPFSSDGRGKFKDSLENIEINKLDTSSPSDEGGKFRSYQKMKNWMNNYESYDDRFHENKESVATDSYHLNFGTPNTTIPISNVPCGGCGAHLHCQDTAIPGYLPSELFMQQKEEELRSMKCQRCHFLENYNMALNLTVAPDAYSLLMEHIKRKRALVILMVDVADFPCSLWPGVIDIIGPKRPVVVVGNKVDLLPSDSRNFIAYSEWWLKEAVKRSELSATKVKYVALVSAKTGYGIEQLITKLHTIWKPDGDVYLLGCTNVGKSTLFNALVKSDYCKIMAMDIMQRATTSQWPGTTLNLLKFPIRRLRGPDFHERVLRLRNLGAKEEAEQQLKRDQQKHSRDPLERTFIGQIGFTSRDTSKMTGALDPFSMKMTSTTQVRPKYGLDPNDEALQETRWCYDTPGAVHPNQILHMLTAEELLLTLPRHMLIPRTFLLTPGDSLLIAGLGRLDFLDQEGPGRTRFTVFAAHTLPITVCCTSDVQVVYEALAAANALQVPMGQKERLAQWPSLESHPEELKVSGVSTYESAADIVLSSAGWVAVTPAKESTCTLLPWTPHGRGIHLRQPALMRFSVNLRGPLVRKTPAYQQGRAVKI